MDKVIGLITTNYDLLELSDLTSERCVATLPFGGRYRLIDFPLSNMINSEIKSVGVITPWKYRSIIDHLGNGSEWSLDRKNGGLFILPGSMYGISTHDSKFLLRDLINNQIFLTRTKAPYILVTSGNTIYSMDYREMIGEHISSGADITLAYNIATEDNDITLSIQTENDQLQGLSHGVKCGEKTFIDTFIINRSFILQLMEWYSSIDYLDIFDIIKRDFTKFHVNLYEFNGSAYNIHSIQSYFDTNLKLLDTATSDELFKVEAPIITKVQDAAPTRYLAGSNVRNSLISAGSVIEGTVENSILSRDVIVQKGAVIRNSIIMKSCVIEAGAQIEYSIIDRNNTIKHNTTFKGSPDAIFIEKKKITNDYSRGRVL